MEADKEPTKIINGVRHCNICDVSFSFNCNCCICVHARMTPAQLAGLAKGKQK